MPSKDYTQTLCKIILFRHQSFKPSIHSKDELACSRPFLQHLIQSLMLHIFLHVSALYEDWNPPYLKSNHLHLIPG